jgi:hypothetical protein
MPFYDEAEFGQSRPIVADPAPYQPVPAGQRAPILSDGERFARGFMGENPVGMALDWGFGNTLTQQLDKLTAGPRDEAFDAFKHTLDNGMDAYMPYLVHMPSRTAWQSGVDQIKKRERQDEMVSMSGWGVTGQIAGQALFPTMAEVKMVGSSAVMASTAITAGQEALAHAQQPQRSAEMSALNIGLTAAITGMFEGGARLLRGRMPEKGAAKLVEEVEADAARAMGQEAAAAEKAEAMELARSQALAGEPLRADPTMRIVTSEEASATAPRLGPMAKAEDDELALELGKVDPVGLDATSGTIRDWEAFKGWTTTPEGARWFDAWHESAARDFAAEGDRALAKLSDDELLLTVLETPEPPPGLVDLDNGRIIDRDGLDAWAQGHRDRELGVAALAEHQARQDDLANALPLEKAWHSEVIKTRDDILRVIDRDERIGTLKPEEARQIKALMQAVPEAFIAGMRLTMKEANDRAGMRTLGVNFMDAMGLYQHIGDWVTVFTGMSRMGGADEVGKTLTHEVGHRVMAKFLTDAEQKVVDHLWDTFWKDTKHADFLSRYKNDDALRRSEWFAESFADYWTRRLAGADKSTWLGGKEVELVTRADDMRALERAFIQVAVAIRDFVRKAFGRPISELTEEEAIDNFFRALGKRAEGVDPAAFIAELESKKVNPASLPDDFEPPFRVSARQGTNASRPDGEGLRDAFGLEKMPDSPVKRIMNARSRYARELISQLVEHPFYQVKNALGEATARGVDRLVSITWVPPMVDAIRASEDAYLAYRRRVSGDAANGLLRQSAKDMFVGRDGAISSSEFFQQIGKAKRRLEGGDLAGLEPEAVEAARVWKSKVYDPLGDAAHQLDAFTLELRRELKGVERALRREKDAGIKAELRNQAAQLQDQINRIRAEPLDPNYLNRVYNTRLVEQERARFEAILREHGYSAKGATAATDLILSGRPMRATADEDAVGMARSIRERSIDVPDEAIERYLESDMLKLGRFYTLRMAPDVELMRKFGSIDLKEHLDAISRRYERAINAETGAIKKQALMTERDQVLEDIRVVRDRIRGTYGIPDNPDSWSYRGIRLAKQFVTMTTLTGALAGLPDLARPVMYEGFRRTYGGAFRDLIGNLDALKLAKAEANLAGEAFDSYLSIRAALFADIGDVVGASTPVEQWMGRATSTFFTVNLMNQWTDAMKSMAALTIGTRIVEESRKWASGAIGQAEIEKLARGGIDQDMARRIAEQADKHGEKLKHSVIARTDLWDDAEAAQAYRAALGKDINIVIITPGKGELPNFISKPLASLFFMYKSFGIAAMQRSLVAGLQERHLAFLNGTAMLVGLGAMVDAIRYKQTGHGDDNRPLADRMMNAIDRSGALGWFTDVNNGIETVTDNQFGIRPMLGAGRNYRSDEWSKAGVVLGPMVQQAKNAARVMTGAVDGQMDQHEAKAARSLLLGNKVFWADGVFDAVEHGMRH